MQLVNIVTPLVLESLCTCEVTRKQTHKHDLRLSSAAKVRKPSVSDCKQTPFGMTSKPITQSV